MQGALKAVSNIASSVSKSNKDTYDYSMLNFASGAAYIDSSQIEDYWDYQFQPGA